MKGERRLRAADLLRRLEMLRTILLAVFAYAGGLVFRYLYLLRLHHPRNLVVSDAAGLMEIARRFLNPGPCRD